MGARKRDAHRSSVENDGEVRDPPYLPIRTGRLGQARRERRSFA